VHCYYLEGPSLKRSQRGIRKRVLRKRGGKRDVHDKQKEGEILFAYLSAGKKKATPEGGGAYACGGRSARKSERRGVH